MRNMLAGAGLVSAYSSLLIFLVRKYAHVEANARIQKLEAEMNDARKVLAMLSPPLESIKAQGGGQKSVGDQNLRHGESVQLPKDVVIPGTSVGEHEEADRQDVTHSLTQAAPAVRHGQIVQITKNPKTVGLGLRLSPLQVLVLTLSALAAWQSLVLTHLI
eukprot:TRINITY_DN9645_c0_g1_i2.p1 TRINITY_DN9645_c0_g1~~TRINITY_DN9645_c0_g1_i2.p1  ORF type:complete len:161 (-),score=24.68 TRINITY_DN9645_c0_g1_i2:137-619(-)